MLEKIPQKKFKLAEKCRKKLGKVNFAEIFTVLEPSAVKLFQLECLNVTKTGAKVIGK